MKILLGKSAVSKFRAKTEDVLFENEQVVLSGKKGPKFHLLQPAPGKFVALFGVVHAIDKGGKYQKLESANAAEKLNQHFSRVTLANLSETVLALEGIFVGLYAEGGEAAAFGDRFNRRELFYARLGDGLVAATGIESIVGHLEGKKAYDQAALANLLTVYGNYAPKRHTIYQNVRRLGVGEQIELSRGGIQFSTRPYQPQPVREYGPEQLEEYAATLRSAVEVRSSESRNWVFMSSGWDSSSVLAHLCDIHGASKVRCGIARMKYDPKVGVVNEFEVSRAKKITDFFGVPLDIVESDYTGADYLRFWDTIRGDFRSLHIYSLFGYNVFKLGEHMGKNGSPTDAAFNGEVSDGAHNLGFSQYATILSHPDLGFREYSDKMISYLFGPSFFRRIAKGDFSKDLVFQFLKNLKDPSVPDQTPGTDKEWKKKYIASFFLSGARLPFSKPIQCNMLTARGHERSQSEISESYFSDFATHAQAETVYSWILHLYNSFHWQGGTVRSLLNAADHYGIPSCAPFWDSKLHQFLASMPENWGRGLDIHPTKYPLKWTLQNKIKYPAHLQVGPHSYVYDVDPNWSADADIVFGSAGAPYFKEKLKSRGYEEVLDAEYFDLGRIGKLVDRYVQGEVFGGQDRTDLKNLVSLVNVGWY